MNAALGLARAIEKTDTSNAGRTRAFECYRTVCQLSPGKTPVFLKAGKLAYDLGRYGEAAEIYSRAVAATPSNIDAIDGLIRSLQKTGGSQKKGSAVIPIAPRNRDIIQAVRRYRHGLEEIAQNAVPEAPGDKALWFIPRPSRRRPIGKSGGR